MMERQPISKLRLYDSFCTYLPNADLQVFHQQANIAGSQRTLEIILDPPSRSHSS
jgi:hypothetical protein